MCFARQQDPAAVLAITLFYTDQAIHPHPRSQQHIYNSNQQRQGAPRQRGEAKAAKVATTIVPLLTLPTIAAPVLRQLLLSSAAAAVPVSAASCCCCCCCPLGGYSWTTFQASVYPLHCDRVARVYNQEYGLSVTQDSIP